MTTTALPRKKNGTILGWEIIGLELSKIQSRKLESLIKSNNFNPHNIRVTLDERCAVCINEKERTITFWRIFGITPSYSETVYDILDVELQNPERPNLQARLQDLTGFRAPIIIDTLNYTIRFIGF